MTLHGFAYTPELERRLKAGEIVQREWTASNGHRHRTTLSWNERIGAPHVSQIDLEIALRIMREPV